MNVEEHLREGKSDSGLTVILTLVALGSAFFWLHSLFAAVFLTLVVNCLLRITWAIHYHDVWKFRSGETVETGRRPRYETRQG